MPAYGASRRHKGLVRHTFDQLLLVDAIRWAVAAARFVVLVHVLRRLRTFSATGPVAPATIRHNLIGLRDLAVARSNTLLRPLSVIESLSPSSAILSVGPRTEGELLNLVAHGFTRASIRAIDLISYSPWVELGDMHHLPYPDASFDAAVLGWVLAYSEEPARAASEVLRVLRDGGIVAAGVEYNPMTVADVERTLGYVPGSRKRIGSCDDLLACFGEAVGEVLYKHDIEPRDRAQVGSLVVIFRARRRD